MVSLDSFDHAIIYVFGGEIKFLKDSESFYSNKVFRYEDETSGWNRDVDLLRPRFGHVSVALELESAPGNWNVFHIGGPGTTLVYNIYYI